MKNTVNPPWNSSELHLLRKYYGSKTAAEISAIIGTRTPGSVIAKAKKLELDKEVPRVPINWNPFEAITRYLANRRWRNTITVGPQVMYRGRPYKVTVLGSRRDRRIGLYSVECGYCPAKLSNLYPII